MYCVHSHPTGKKKKLSTRSSRSRNVTGLVLNETEETFDRCCFQFTRTLTRGAPVRNESSIRILLIRNRGASEGKQKEKENSSGKLALSFPSVRRTYQTSTQEFSISSFCLPGALVPLKPTARPFQQRGVLPRIEMNHPAILSLSLSLPSSCPIDIHRKLISPDFLHPVTPIVRCNIAERLRLYRLYYSEENWSHRFHSILVGSDSLYVRRNIYF